MIHNNLSNHKLITYLLIKRNRKQDCVTKIFSSEFRNIAYGKPAWQSSLPKVGVASRAVDGNMDYLMDYLNCTYTSDETGAWWVVDLQSNYLITEVVVSYGRGMKLSSIRTIQFSMLSFPALLSYNCVLLTYQYRTDAIKCVDC